MGTSASDGHRILIVEHTREIRELLASCLQLEGYETDTAVSLEEALEKVEGHRYQLVLTDTFARPNQSRLSAVQPLQQHCHPTPVGILTGWHLDEGEVKRAGFAFVLQKPIDLETLVQCVAEHITPPRSPA